MSEIKDKLDPDFQILPPDKLFENWENQGVLLLNTSFTCEVGAPGSHSEFWKIFTNQLLEFIATENPNITWFIWGNHARESVKNIQIKNKLVSMHPMMCYNKPERTSDFLFGNILLKSSINLSTVGLMLANWIGSVSYSVFLKTLPPS